MTGESHTIQSAIVTYGAYAVLLGGVIAYGIRAHLRDAREQRERAAAEAARLRAAWRRAERRAPLASVGARIATRQPAIDALEVCESIWNETLVWGIQPDEDLLSEWEWFCADDEADDDEVAY